MKIFTIILSFFLSCVGLFANVGWTLVEKEGKAYIGYDFDSERKVPPTTEGLSALLAKRDKSLPLKQISFWAYFNNDPVIQGELLEVFHARCPKVLSDALRSAGNMHNPKVLPLRSELPDCLLMTPTIKKLNVILRDEGFEIKDLFHEKFSINKEQKELKFYDVISLNLTSLVNKESK